MPAGLVEEIQKAAIDPNAAVSTLLRQVKLAAFRLKLDTVEYWVEAELNGYSNGAELPAYRKVEGSAVVQTLHEGWQPLVLEKDTEFLRTASIRDSVASIETLLANRKNGTLVKRYPVGIIANISKANDAQITQGGCSIQRSSFVSILDSVRNLVLDWAIKLERAGVTGDGLSFSVQEQQQARETQSVINVGMINSMTGNLGIGITSGDITNAPLSIDQVKNLISQVKSHAKTLTSEGVDGPALTAALQAIEKQLSSEHPTLLRNALGELEKVVVKASGSLIAHGVLAILHQILGTGIPA
jgi:hypothetical protein